MTKPVSLFASFALSLGFVSVALSEEGPLTGGGRMTTIVAQSFERTVEGRLDSCEITYTVAFEDYINRNGGMVLIRGAVAVNGATGEPDKSPYVVFKMTPFDVQEGGAKLAPVNYAFLSVSDRSYARKEFVKFRCEDGGLCVGYEMLKHPDLALALGVEFGINFNRKPGSSDIQVPIHMLRDQPEASLAHGECVVKLLDELKKKLGG